MCFPQCDRVRVFYDTRARAPAGACREGAGGKGAALLGGGGGDPNRRFGSGGEPVAGAGAAHPDALVRGVARAIARAWPKGVKWAKVVAEGTAVEWKLNGYPWMANGGDTVDVRRLVCAVLEAALDDGWRLHASVDCQLNGDVSSLFLRRDLGASAPLLPAGGAAAAAAAQRETTRRPPHRMVSCLSLNMTDRVRLIGMDHPRAQAAVRGALARHWPGGVVSERAYHGAHEYKLKGRPWLANGEATAHARVALAKVLEALAVTCGLVPLPGAGALDLSRKVNDKGTFFFAGRDADRDRVYDETGARHPLFPVAVVALHRRDTVRVANAPPELVDAVRRALRRAWPPGVQRETPAYGGVAYEVKLRGYPWHAHGTDTVHARAIAGHLAAAVRACGWEVVASADVSGKTEGTDDQQWPADVDSWFCRSTLPVVAAAPGGGGGQPAATSLAGGLKDLAEGVVVAVPVAAAAAPPSAPPSYEAYAAGEARPPPYAVAVSRELSENGRKLLQSGLDG